MYNNNLKQHIFLKTSRLSRCVQLFKRHIQLWSIVRIEWRRKCESGFGFEECVAEQYAVQMFKRRIIGIVGINVEEHGQFNLFTWIQDLFLEAKALNLVEIVCGLKWS